MPGLTLWLLILAPPVVAGMFVLVTRRLIRRDVFALAPSNHGNDDVTVIRPITWLACLLPVIQMGATGFPLAWLQETTRFRLCNRATLAIVLLVLVGNWSAMPLRLRRPVAVVAAGVFLNSCPRIALGGMPYDLGSARLAGVRDGLMEIHQAGHIAITDGLRAWWPISDVIPVPGIHAVLSIGDVAMVVGLTVVLLRLWPTETSEGRPSPEKSAPTKSTDRKARSKLNTRVWRRIRYWTAATALAAATIYSFAVPFTEPN